jgi:hypothetical protein
MAALAKSWRMRDIGVLTAGATTTGIIEPSVLCANECEQSWGYDLVAPKLIIFG